MSRWALWIFVLALGAAVPGNGFAKKESGIRGMGANQRVERPGAALPPLAKGAGGISAGDTGAPDGWFRSERLANLIGVLVFSAMCLFLIYRGRRGARHYIRPIAGLRAFTDAVGRAAEMGRPIMYIPGLSDVSDPATAASMSILSRVAFSAARLRTTMKVPCYSALTFPVARSVVGDAFLRAGRAEVFSPDDVQYLTSRHMTYTMAVVGMMSRERVAANFLIGHFFSESLILAETGAALGALQIGGCDAVAQIPFFITTCDYTLIGEELFAAGALMGDDPLSRATIVAHDWFKALIILVLFAGAALMLLDALGVDSAGALMRALKDALAEGPI